MFTNSKQFADEEKESDFIYPQAYKIKGLMDQVDILSQFFPNISHLRDEQWSLLYKTLPPNAEGWFVLPRWQKIKPTYCEALREALGILASHRRFQNCFGENFQAANLRRYPKTAKMMQGIAEHQNPPFGGDIVVVPCQFGMRHRGRSVRRARAVFSDNEFGLGAFEVVCMLLTHPERELGWGQLHIDCPGDECSADSDGKFSSVPVFSTFMDNLEFDVDWFGRVYKHYGSASAFLAL